MQLILITLAILVPAASHAGGGDWVGNGGNVVACETNGKVTKADLLDFYETGMSLKERSGNYEAIALERVTRLKELAPKLAEQYARRLESLKSEWSIREGVKLTKIEDSKHAFEPEDKNCAVQQTVVRLPELTDGKRFLVNKKFWAALSETGKAGLLMHEVVYEHFFKLGAKDSRKARQFVILMFTEKFDKMNSGDFWLYIKDLKVPVYP